MKASKDFFSKIRVDNAEEKQLACDNNCLLCERGTPSILEASSTWSDTAQVILFCLHNSKPHVKFFNLKSDIYPFVDAHYDLLCCAKTGNAGCSWKKCLQDALSHNKDMFESGTKEKGKGWWNLTDRSDPWREDPLDTQRKIIYKMYHPEPTPHGERKRLQDRLHTPTKRHKSLLSLRDDAAAPGDNNERPESNEAPQPLEEEFTAMHSDMFSRIRELKDEVSKFKEEFTLKRKQNIVRLHQLDELIRNVTPTIIDTVQSLEQEIITQKANQEGKIQVAKTALAVEGLYQIKNQWQEMKDMRHSISFITSSLSNEY